MGCTRIRYLVCLSAWVTLLALYSQRINLSIGIIGMIKEKTTVSVTDSCPNRNLQGATLAQSSTERFIWDEAMQNYLLLAYNVGYMIGHVPGAFLSIKYGSRNVMIFCMVSSTLLTLISTFVARYQWIFFAIRTTIGLVNGPLYPLVHQTISSYSPEKERTFLTMFTHTGNIVSLAIIFPIGGVLIENIVNGWQYIFYISVGLGVLATVLWILFVYSDPSENPRMSEYEKQYIINSVYPNGKPPKMTFASVPFKKIFMNRHIYIFTMVHFGKLFILYMNLFGIVKYLFKFFNLTPIAAGNLAVIPFVADFVFQMIYARFVGYLNTLGWSKTKIRRLNTFIGACGCSLFLIAGAFVSCEHLVAGVIFQSLSLMFLAPYQAGYFTAIIDYAPQYASITFAFINIGGTLSGVVQRYIQSILSQKIPDIRVAYKYSFLIAGIVSFVLSMAYVIFGTAELQSWAKPKPKPKKKRKVDIYSFAVKSQ